MNLAFGALYVSCLFSNYWVDCLQSRQSIHTQKLPKVVVHVIIIKSTIKI